ncbi:DUF6481 family protein [Roseococcus sp. YIM B11640]|uniref:DUF6481 family protein n=1 Tax=Roseococcus sp. YIM B11640 TaxID=3133973 RepID=UPI003C7BFD69
MAARRDTFDERRGDAAAARLKLLEKFKARPPSDSPEVQARLEAQRLQGEKRRAKEAEAIRRAEEKAAALLAEKEAAAAAKKAAAIAAAANAAAEARRRTAMMLAQQKAERDARIAAQRKKK